MLEDEQSQTRSEGERQAPVDALTTAAHERTRDQASAEHSIDDDDEHPKDDGAPRGTMESTWGGEASHWAREALRRQCVHSGGRDSLIRIEHHVEYRCGEGTRQSQHGSDRDPRYRDRDPRYRYV
jgi:hypothetical protein